MKKIPLFLLLHLFLIFFSTYSFAQSKTPSKLEIKNTAKQAVNYLNLEKYEKSLEAARLSLNYATILKDNYLIAVSYNVIAANFDALSEFDKAIFFYKKGLLRYFSQRKAAMRMSRKVKG